MHHYQIPQTAAKRCISISKRCIFSIDAIIRIFNVEHNIRQLFLPTFPTQQTVQMTVASFTKEFNPQLVKRPLKTNGSLAYLELTSLVKEANGR